MKLIEKALASEATLQHVDKTVVSLLFHCSKDEGCHEACMGVLQGVLRRALSLTSIYRIKHPR